MPNAANDSRATRGTKSCEWDDLSRWHSWCWLRKLELLCFRSLWIFLFLKCWLEEQLCLNKADKNQKNRFTYTIFSEQAQTLQSRRPNWSTYFHWEVCHQKAIILSLVQTRYLLEQSDLKKYWLPDHFLEHLTELSYKLFRIFCCMHRWFRWPIEWYQPRPRKIWFQHRYSKLL